MLKSNPGFLTDLQKYGSYDFSKCYNCGTCTATCGLAEDNASFPRMLIRHGVLGLKKKLVSSKEIWLCYSCGDCSTRCPRQAEPSAYMDALRRYSIGQLDPTGLSRMLFKNNPLSILFTLILAFFLGFFMMTMMPRGTEVERWIFEKLPFDPIHDLGIYIFMFTGLVLVIGVIRMAMILSKNERENGSKKPKHSIWYGAKMVLNELFTMKRFRDCDEDAHAEEEEYWKDKAWYMKPWFVHWSIMWGFIGLVVATTLNFIFKDPATMVWWPTRILGIITGLLMMWGTSLALIYRIKKVTRSYQNSRLFDWMFLSFIWIAGFTGFWIMIAVFMNAESTLNHIVFLVHTIASMEMIVLFALSKFAHAIYRPIALFIHYRNS